MSRGSARVWRLLGPEEIELCQVPEPAPREAELVVAVEAATVCGTDLKVFARGGHPTMLQAPAAFGHEMAGRVVALGERLESFALGDRVALANSAPCGRCASCGAGRENLCSDLHYLNGAFADRILVPERFCKHSVYLLPDSVPLELAPLAEPLACVLHCLERIRPLVAAGGPEQPRVVIFGAGPIGLLLTGELTRAGYRVTAVDPHRERLRVAAGLGARDTVRARNLDGAGADLAIDATGRIAGWSACCEAVRPGGVAALFGGTSGERPLALDAHRIHYQELAVLGVYHYRPRDFVRALSALGEHRLPYERLITHELPLDQLPQALDLMRRRQALKVRLTPGGEPS